MKNGSVGTMKSGRGGVSLYQNSLIMQIEFSVFAIKFPLLPKQKD